MLDGFAVGPPNLSKKISRAQGHLDLEQCQASKQLSLSISQLQCLVARGRVIIVQRTKTWISLIKPFWSSTDYTTDSFIRMICQIFMASVVASDHFFIDTNPPHTQPLPCLYGSARDRLSWTEICPIRMDSKAAISTSGSDLSSIPHEVRT